MTHSSTIPSVARSSVTRRFALTLLLLLLIVSVVVWFWTRETPLPEGVSEEVYARAVTLYQERYRRPPSRPDALALLGELAVRENDLDLALACFSGIPDDDPLYGASARLQAAHVSMKHDRAAAAERQFRAYLHLARQASPEAHSVTAEDIHEARSWLCYLLSVQLRLEERNAVLASMHAEGHPNVFNSKQYFFPNLLIWNSTRGQARLSEFLAETPDDPQLNIARGRYLTGAGQLREARAHLEYWSKQLGPDRACLAALLECHFERNDWEAFDAVLQDVPAPQDNDPWLLTLMRGESAVHRQRWEDAIGHFEHLIADDPNHVTAWMGLARACRALERDEQAAEARRRALILAEIRPALLGVTETDPAASEELAKQCDRLPHPEAATVFRQHAERIRAAARGRSQKPQKPQQTPSGPETLDEAE